MDSRKKSTPQETIDMSGYVMIGFGFGAVIGLLVGNMILGGGIGMCFGILLAVCAEL